MLGVGHLAGFILQGLNRTQICHRFVLSPRNRERAEALSRQYGAEVAVDNQAVVDMSDIVLVCLPAASGREILTGLTFCKDQIVLSAMAGTGQGELERIVSPAAACRTMMPGHANALGIGPSLLYPANAACEDLLQRLGPVHVLDDAATFEVACVFGAFSGASFVYMQRIIAWFELHGVPAGIARNLIAETLGGNAEVVRNVDQSLETIVKGIATPGGITRQVLDIVEADGGLDIWPSALETVHKRMRNGMD